MCNVQGRLILRGGAYAVVLSIHDHSNRKLSPFVTIRITLKYNLEALRVKGVQYRYKMGEFGYLEFDITLVLCSKCSQILLNYTKQSIRYENERK